MKCILFDFDGTIVDTQICYDIAASNNLIKINKKYTIEFCLQYFGGRGWKDVFAEIAQTEDKIMVEEALQNALKMAHDLTYKNLQTTKNVNSTLLKLRNEGYKMAICSNSKFQTIKGHLERVNIKEFFPDEVIFALESVKNPKPSGEVFTKAQKYFDAEPSDCLIIEDSLAGLMAGFEAKIPSILFTGGGHHKKNPLLAKNILARLKEMKEDVLIGQIDDMAEIFTYLK